MFRPIRALRSSTGVILATKMQMHNKDVLFVANAQSVEIRKFTQFLDALLTTANNVTTLGTNVETWRIDSHIH